MTKRYFAVLMVMTLMFAGGASVGAQTTTPPKVLSAEGIQDLTKAENLVRYAALSPDGTKIGWLDNEGKQICLFTIADTTSECSPFAENFGHVGRFSSVA